ncbi:MAG TPA: peroxiredoxin [Candidatus Binataceae bacterium]|nr:peroxiredoxin [Candidatus Binataceae bacterium]
MPSTEGLRAGDDLGAVAQIALRDQHGNERRLADFRGHGLVIYFYPADDTPGCTVEGREFRDLDEAFASLKCAVVGVSVDSVESHRAFAEKHGFRFVLLSDPKGALASAFGVLRGGIAARSTFVLNADLRVARAFHEVTPRGHAQRVLDFVRSILESHRMLGG